MGTNPVVPQLENAEWSNVGQAGYGEQDVVQVKFNGGDDAGEYESKFLATSKLLEQVSAERSVLDRKLTLAMAELKQYAADLQFWKQAHASDYPERRKKELQAKMDEIEAVK